MNEQAPARAATPIRTAHMIGAVAVLIAAGAVFLAARTPARPAPPQADTALVAWAPAAQESAQPAPGERDRCHDELSVRSDETKEKATPAAPRGKPDPLTGDTVRKVSARRGCVCAALDPACACLPVAAPCPTPGASPDEPCRYF